MSTSGPSRPSSGARINHLVLNVHDIEASHRFYTEVLGFEQCGDLTHTVTMRFYRGDASRHHDLALVQINDPEQAPTPDAPSMEPVRAGINHFAISYPDRQSWLDQIRHMKACGVEFVRRGNHGMTHSAYLYDPDGCGIEVVYDVPAEAWEGDVDAALNYFEFLDLDDLDDTTDYQRFGEGIPEPEAIPGRVNTRQLRSPATQTAAGRSSAGASSLASEDT